MSARIGALLAGYTVLRDRQIAGIPTARPGHVSHTHRQQQEVAA